MSKISRDNMSGTQQDGINEKRAIAQGRVAELRNPKDPLKARRQRVKTLRTFTSAAVKTLAFLGANDHNQGSSPRHQQRHQLTGLRSANDQFSSTAIRHPYGKIADKSSPFESSVMQHTGHNLDAVRRLPQPSISSQDKRFSKGDIAQEHRDRSAPRLRQEEIKQTFHSTGSQNPRDKKRDSFGKSKPVEELKEEKSIQFQRKPADEMLQTSRVSSEVNTTKSTIKEQTGSGRKILQITNTTTCSVNSADSDSGITKKEYTLKKVAGGYSIKFEIEGNRTPEQPLVASFRFNSNQAILLTLKDEFNQTNVANLFSSPLPSSFSANVTSPNQMVISDSSFKIIISRDPTHKNALRIEYASDLVEINNRQLCVYSEIVENPEAFPLYNATSSVSTSTSTTQASTPTTTSTPWIANSTSGASTTTPADSIRLNKTSSTTTPTPTTTSTPWIATTTPADSIRLNKTCQLVDSGSRVYEQVFVNGVLQQDRSRSICEFSNNEKNATFKFGNFSGSFDGDSFKFLNSNADETGLVSFASDGQVSGNGYIIKKITNSGVNPIKYSVTNNLGETLNLELTLEKNGEDSKIKNIKIVNTENDGYYLNVTNPFLSNGEMEVDSIVNGTISATYCKKNIVLDIKKSISTSTSSLDTTTSTTFSDAYSSTAPSTTPLSITPVSFNCSNSGNGTQKLFKDNQQLFETRMQMQRIEGHFFEVNLTTHNAKSVSLIVNDKLSDQEQVSLLNNAFKQQNLSNFICQSLSGNITIIDPANNITIKIEKNEQGLYNTRFYHDGKPIENCGGITEQTPIKEENSVFTCSIRKVAADQPEITLYRIKDKDTQSKVTSFSIINEDQNDQLKIKFGEYKPDKTLIVSRQDGIATILNSSGIAIQSNISALTSPVKVGDNAYLKISRNDNNLFSASLVNSIGQSFPGTCGLSEIAPNITTTCQVKSESSGFIINQKTAYSSGKITNSAIFELDNLTGMMITKFSNGNKLFFDSISNNFVYQDSNGTELLVFDKDLKAINGSLKGTYQLQNNSFEVSLGNGKNVRFSMAKSSENDYALSIQDTDGRGLQYKVDSKTVIASGIVDGNVVVDCSSSSTNLKKYICEHSGDSQKLTVDGSNVLDVSQSNRDLTIAIKGQNLTLPFDILANKDQVKQAITNFTQRLENVTIEIDSLNTNKPKLNLTIDGVTSAILVEKLPSSEFSKYQINLLDEKGVQLNCGRNYTVLPNPNPAKKFECKPEQGYAVIKALDSTNEDIKFYKDGDRNSTLVNISGAGFQLKFNKTGGLAQMVKDGKQTVINLSSPFNFTANGFNYSLSRGDKGIDLIRNDGMFVSINSTSQEFYYVSPEGNLTLCSMKGDQFITSQLASAITTEKSLIPTPAIVTTSPSSSNSFPVTLMNILLAACRNHSENISASSLVELMLHEGVNTSEENQTKLYELIKPENQGRVSQTLDLLIEFTNESNIKNKDEIISYINQTKQNLTDCDIDKLNRNFDERLYYIILAIPGVFFAYGMTKLIAKIRKKPEIALQAPVLADDQIRQRARDEYDQGNQDQTHRRLRSTISAPELQETGATAYANLSIVTGGGLFGQPDDSYFYIDKVSDNSLGQITDKKRIDEVKPRFGNRVGGWAITNSQGDQRVDNIPDDLPIENALRAQKLLNEFRLHRNASSKSEMMLREQVSTSRVNLTELLPIEQQVMSGSRKFAGNKKELIAEGIRDSQGNDNHEAEGGISDRETHNYLTPLAPRSFGEFFDKAQFHSRDGSRAVYNDIQEQQRAEVDLESTKTKEYYPRLGGNERRGASTETQTPAPAPASLHVGEASQLVSYKSKVIGSLRSQFKTSQSFRE